MIIRLGIDKKKTFGIIIQPCYKSFCMMNIEIGLIFITIRFSFQYRKDIKI